MQKLNRIDKTGLTMVAILGIFVLLRYRFLWPVLVLIALSYIPVKGK